MLLRWLRRRRIRRTPFSPVHESILRRRVGFWSTLSDSDRARMRDEIRFFIAERYWEGCKGLAVTEEMKLIIAAQACLLLLGRPEDGFRNVSTILLYPSGYFASAQPTPLFGPSRVMAAGSTPVLGQAHERGPVILSWRHVAEGGHGANGTDNLVIHEFAHKLDMASGFVDGAPRLDDPELRRRWKEVFTESFERLRRDLSMGIPTLLRPYAATNPAEFFAVATEVFFERAQAMREVEPDLYGVMREFYRQDPAERCM